MTNKLYTMDAENTGHANEGAELICFPSDVAATNSFLAGSSGWTITGWQEASFGDCWIKVYSEPDIDENGHAEFDGIKCTVNRPGTHPGGNAWWCNPVETVMSPIVEITE